MGYLTLESELNECSYWLEQAEKTCADILVYGLVLDRDRATQAETLVKKALECIKQATDILSSDFKTDHPE